MPDNSQDSDKQEVIQPTKDSESKTRDVAPQEVSRIMSGFMRMSGGTRSGMAILFEKFNAEHIDKYLDYVQRDDDEAAKYRSTNRFFYMGYVIIALIAFGFSLKYLLPNNKEILIQLITLLVSFGGGFGIGRSTKKNNSDDN